MNKLNKFAEEVVDDFKAYDNYREKKRYINIIKVLILKEIEGWTGRKIANEVDIVQSTVWQYTGNYNLPKEFPIWYKAFKVNGYIPYGIEEYTKKYPIETRA